MDSASTKTITMTLDGRASHCVFGPFANESLEEYADPQKTVFIIDENMAGLQRGTQKAWSSAQQDRRVLLLPGGEAVKSLARLEQVYSWLAQMSVHRDQAIVGIGGGTILDLAGMAAATWKRGVPFVAVPTTLLAMVDAAIGGKTAINTAGLKNPVGVFHPATAIFTDVAFLDTLKRDEWRDGLAELIKTALIGDAKLFQEVFDQRENLNRVLGPKSSPDATAAIAEAAPWADWIARAAAVKADVVNRDFRELGPRRALNLGHTLGHVIEASSHQTENPLSHGAAVAVGMAFVFQLSAERGNCPNEVRDQVLDLLQACGLPTTYRCPDDNQLNHLLQSDKKNSSQAGVRWVLPEAVGQMNLHGAVSLAEIKAWLS